MSHPEPLVLHVDPDQVGHRLDAFLASQLDGHTRVELHREIKAGGVTVDGKRAKPAYRLQVGQRVVICLPPPAREGPEPENIPLRVIYEDAQLIAIDKAAGMVVHPAKGHWSGTLAGALAYHFGPLSTIGGPTRPGIVHRLDRETSGVIVVAKTDRAHRNLAAQFEARTVRKQYLAIVQGVPDRDRDVIDRPIGAHPQQREKMAIRAGHATSRQGVTEYQVLERFDQFAAVRVMPRTGRTHQIRVHMAHIGCPVLCDRLYAGRSKITRGELRRQPEDQQVLLARAALHAERLRIVHPDSGQPLDLTAPVPEDIAGVLAELRGYR